MKGATNIYGILILFVTVVILFLLYDYTIIGKDEVFEAVRTTQLSTIEEAVNIGDLIVNNKLSLNEDVVVSKWTTYFKGNSNTQIDYDINFIDISKTPPGIATNVKGEINAYNEKIEFEYSNVVIIEALK